LAQFRWTPFLTGHETIDILDSLVSATMRSELFCGTQYECPLTNPHSPGSTYSDSTVQGIAFFKTSSTSRRLSSLPQIANLPPVSVRQTRRMDSEMRWTPTSSSRAISRNSLVGRLSYSSCYEGHWDSSTIQLDQWARSVTSLSLSRRPQLGRAGASAPSVFVHGRGHRASIWHDLVH
jgi:hypothetical protein